MKEEFEWLMTVGKLKEFLDRFPDDTVVDYIYPNDEFPYSPFHYYLTTNYVDGGLTMDGLKRQVSLQLVGTL